MRRPIARPALTCATGLLTVIVLSTFSMGVIAAAAGVRGFLLIGALVLTGGLGIALASTLFLLVSGRR